MNRANQIAMALLLLSPLACLISAGPAKSDIEVYFSPKGGCTAAIVNEINAAQHTLAIQAYTFTSTDIASAVAKAHDRGVQVLVVLDKKETGSQYSIASYLTDHGIPTYLDGKHPIAHNKIMVIDGQTVIGGSFNYTKQAEDSNAENMMVMHRPDLAAKYEANIKAHLDHSEPYKRAK